MLLLAANGWTVLDNLIEVLVPIAIVVVMPVLVVWLVMRARQHEVDKKTEVLLKSVEEGVQIDPAFLRCNRNLILHGIHALKIRQQKPLLSPLPDDHAVLFYI